MGENTKTRTELKKRSLNLKKGIEGKKDARKRKWAKTQLLSMRNTPIGYIEGISTRF